MNLSLVDKMETSDYWSVYHYFVMRGEIRMGCIPPSTD